MKIIEQKEIQKLGGVCKNYPVSCLIRELLREAGLLKPFKVIKVLDLTFGEGRFWVAIPQAHIIAFDKVRLKWHRKPAEFYKMSCVNWKKKVYEYTFDLVVADPPFMAYRRGQKRRRHYEDNGDLPMILREAEKAAKHFNAYLLVHFIWRAVPYGFDVVTEAWFKAWCRYINTQLPTWFGVLSIV